MRGEELLSPRGAARGGQSAAPSGPRIPIRAVLTARAAVDKIHATKRRELCIPAPLTQTSRRMDLRVRIGGISRTAARGPKGERRLGASLPDREVRPKRGGEPNDLLCRQSFAPRGKNSAEGGGLPIGIVAPSCGENGPQTAGLKPALKRD